MILNFGQVLNLTLILYDVHNYAVNWFVEPLTSFGLNLFDGYASVVPEYTALLFVFKFADILCIPYNTLY